MIANMWRGTSQITRLILSGEPVHVKTQNISEFWAVATRSPAQNGLGRVRAAPDHRCNVDHEPKGRGRLLYLRRSANISSGRHSGLIRESVVTPLHGFVLCDYDCNRIRAEL
jgi:hypothetical protein